MASPFPLPLVVSVSKSQWLLLQGPCVPRPQSQPGWVILHQDARTTSSPIPLPEALSAHRCQESLSFLL